MSLSTNIESISTTASVRAVDKIIVGTKEHNFVQVEYVDAISRPDLVGRLSGWIRVTGSYIDGDVVAIAFTPVPSRLGSITWTPFVR